MHPSLHSKSRPDHPAVIMASTGQEMSYGELERRSNRFAHLFRAAGLRPGDSLAFSLGNCPEFFQIAWAAQRAGLYFVSVSNKLQADEVAYILEDSGAKLFITDVRTGLDLADIERRGLAAKLYLLGEESGSFTDIESALADLPETPIADEEAGMDMLYSSGTTGRPKGIKPKQARGLPIDADDAMSVLAVQLYGMSADTIYLSPAPLYHAAPLRWCMTVMRLGGTVVIMETFDPEQALRAVEAYRVTMAQFVPTHFIRMLKLPESVRPKYDLTTLSCVLHAAAPCPVPVKEAMMEWWGPIIHEYYGGSEGCGGTFIGPSEWLERKGSVGRSLGTMVHICDDEGKELPPRSEGLIYFSGGQEFEYHNDPEKTREARHTQGWSTLGDIGWVDEEGYLYLTDRKSFMIISGGVNIYPQEIENLLITHPKVADVAVIGAPDADMGERVVAVVQPADWKDAGDALASELSNFAREHLSHVKAPRQIDFRKQLPRLDTGKLFKRLIRDAYWQKESPAHTAA